MNWVQLRENLKEMRLAQLSAELMVMQMVLVSETCWAQLMENCSEQSMVLMMETSSACLLAEWMVMQKVPLMDVGSVQLMELCWEQLMVMQTASSLVCLSAQRTAMLKVILLGCLMVMSSVRSSAAQMATQKDSMMEHMRL